MKIVISTKRELPKAVRKLLNHTGKNRLLAFYGSMGAGKTTIIKAICESLGAKDAVTSPTFTLVNEYITPDGDSLYHIDFYRIKKRDEVFDLGIEEYLSSGFYCFMEWPELIEDILPPETVKVRITVGPDEVRILEIP
ncbi:MAG: tRNA threonylcarbamoyladenosine biosynthesis protein TsaE [Bacteroidota bacterium]|nr:tRNA threonylcarbamoyladenosine biosynthesis protein TsaE [Bacteroidota bacterium]